MAEHQEDWVIDVIIAVTVVIAVLFIVLAALWLYCCLCRQRKTQHSHQQPAQHGNGFDQISRSSLSSLDKNNHVSGHSGKLDSSHAHARTASTGRHSTMPGWQRFFRRTKSAGGRFRTRKPGTRQKSAAPRMHGVRMDPSIRLKISNDFRPRSHPNMGFATVGAMTSSNPTVPVYMQHVGTAPRFTTSPDFNRSTDGSELENMSIGQFASSNSVGTGQNQHVEVLESPTGTLQGSYILEGSNHMGTRTRTLRDTSPTSGSVLTTQDVGTGVVGVADDSAHAQSVMSVL